MDAELDLGSVCGVFNSRDVSAEEKFFSPLAC